MLTRLKVSGFKNLVDVDVRFGPFTCVAGANGVGKSNLFDAIEFLSALAEMPLMEAAKSIRGGRTVDIANLFHRIGKRRDETMSFEAEMIIPREGADDLGQKAKATITFLRYTLELGLMRADGNASYGGLMIHKESLDHININDASQHLLFSNSKIWRKSVIEGRRTVPFISTDAKSSGTIIQLHQDRGGSGGGRPAPFLAATLPRTVLSSVNAAENRTAVLGRREMQSWRRLQLEPAALREPDTFATRPRLGSDGSHLAATLHYLANGGASSASLTSPDSERHDSSAIYGQVAGRLTELIDDVREVGVEVDPQRELLTIFARGKDGTQHPARALSDGTLRFLALAVIELDPTAQGVICLEEPENGLHPERIPAMLRLLKDIAVSTEDAVDADNPLRQIIINTHSPAVVSEVDDDSLIFAQLREVVRDGRRFQGVHFASLSDTWRKKGNEPDAEVSKGEILVYLSGPVPARELAETPSKTVVGNGKSPRSVISSGPVRVIDRPDMQRLLNFGDHSE